MEELEATAADLEHQLAEANQAAAQQKAAFEKVDGAERGGAAAADGS